MKALLIAVAILFCAHSASVAGERGRGGGIHRGGGNAVHSQRGPSGGNWQNRGGPNRGWSGNRGGGGYHHRGGWGYRSDDFAGGILGGLIGGAIGSIFAPEPEPPVVIIQQPPPAEGPAPWSPEWYDYCNTKYKSFDAKTGYYRGYDSQDHFCK